METTKEEVKAIKGCGYLKGTLVMIRWAIQRGCSPDKVLRLIERGLKRVRLLGM